MQFPVYLRIGSLQIHPHWVFEAVAYAVAFRLFLTLRRQGDTLDDDARWWVIAAAAAGAAVGSKVLYWLEEPRLTYAHWHDPIFLMGGKTIVGALVGGLLAVEWSKRRLGITRRTGDLFALPLCVGIAIGRVGCFLTGLEDHTSGIHTALAWGVDFGDGPRHPTQLYEILFMILLGLGLMRYSRRAHSEGDLFKCFMVGYFAFRFAVDFLKPDLRAFAGLSSIQWACIFMLGYYAADLFRRLGALRAPVSQPSARP
jgi:phosphatidylglycerol:prolipoprotein diacylglycerol transferase